MRYLNVSLLVPETRGLKEQRFWGGEVKNGRMREDERAATGCCVNSFLGMSAYGMLHKVPLLRGGPN